VSLVVAQRNSRSERNTRHYGVSPKLTFLGCTKRTARQSRAALRLLLRRADQRALLRGVRGIAVSSCSNR
jgi:hypothetical protein